MAKITPEISQHLNVMRGFRRDRVKTATSPGDDKLSFEQAFSNIAHAYIKSEAPTLLDYEVGFQLIDRNQESTKAIGIFGFKVGSQWLYAPVFFLNGELKGHELLYMKNHDLFVPLKENWLNYIMNKKPSVLGGGVDKNLRQIGVMQPHLYQLSHSPSKFAAMRKVADWARPFMPVFASVVTGNPAKRTKQASALSLPEFLKKEGRAVLRSLLSTFREEPKLAAAFAHFHGLDIIDSLVNELNVAEKAASTKSALGDQLGNGVFVMQRSVRIYTVDDVTRRGNDLVDTLSKEDREKLVRENVVIKDDRPDNAVTNAYRVETPVRLTSPSESGLYDVLVRPNKLEKCVVLCGPYSNTGRETFATIIRLSDDGPKAWLNVHPSHIWTTKQYEPAEFREWFKELPEGTLTAATDNDDDSAYDGTLNVLLYASGQATLPFDIRRELGGDTIDCYDVSFRDWAERSRPDHLPRLQRVRKYDDFSATTPNITLTHKDGNQPRAIGSTLYLPDGYKILRLARSTYADNNPVVLGNVTDIENMLSEKTAVHKIYDAGSSELDIDGKRFSKTAGLVYLVRDMGLREHVARELLKQARDQRTVRFRVKKAAQEYNLQKTGPSSPTFPQAVSGYDPFAGGQYPTENPQEWNQRIPDLSPDNTDRSIYLPMGPDPQYQQGPDRHAQQAALQAAQTGQQEVFDTAMIGSLLKAVRDDSMVDRYLGDLMKAIDRLGRIIMLFYWHNEAFEERYGKDDMVEMEDGLRNAFEYLGDITLLLKQKSIGDLPGQNDIDLSAISG